jgi:hypothetical protein
MKIIGCDFHPGYQQIAMLDSVTGEIVEKALSHERKEEVRAFYAGLEGPVCFRCMCSCIAGAGIIRQDFHKRRAPRH